jgi:hypothetical protein
MIKLAISSSVFRVCDVQRRRKLAESFIKVIHLCQDTDCHKNDEDVCRCMGELVFAAQGQF